VDLTRSVVTFRTV